MNENLRTQIQAEIYKRSFYDFVVDAVKVLEPTTIFDWNWHIKYLADTLQNEGLRIKDGRPKEHDILINVPFRSMKSLLTSILYPCWLWAIDDSMKIMTVAYSEGLAIKQAFLSKIILRSEWYTKHFPNVIMNADDNSKSNYSTTNSGTRQAYSLEGQLTGSGGNVLILDDPHRVNATSKQIQNANEAYDEMLYNRINDPEIGIRIIIGQRIRDDDLFGHLLENNDGEYYHINIPAEESEDITPLFLTEYYYEGLFWNNRFSHNILAKYFKALGSRSYNAQLNQRTVAEGGNILKEDWFNIIPYEEELHKKIVFNIYIDSAYTAKKGNDPTAILIAGKIHNEMVVLKSFTYHLEFPDLLVKIKAIARTYCTSMSRIYIEGKASGKSILQALKRDSTLSVIELPNVDTDKEARCHSISPIVESGRINLIKDNSWNKNFVSEVTKFPLGKNDDQLDTLMYAIDNMLTKNTEMNYAI